MARVLSPRFYLLAYLLALVVLTLVHRPEILGVSLVLALCASGRRRWYLLRRAVTAVLAFNLSVSLAYLGLAIYRGTAVGETLLLLNLRVVLLVYLGFWFVSAVNFSSALAAWPLLGWLVSLAVGQIKTFQRVLNDFRLAFESRNLVRPNALGRTYHAAAQARALLDKTMAAATDSAQAMRSRGVFEQVADEKADDRPL